LTLGPLRPHDMLSRSRIADDQRCSMSYGLDAAAWP
jgi:hypothetical protein